MMTRTQALLKIAKRDGGVITPAAVIAEARNPKSVLHGAFTWDNTKAAEKWRIHEAQLLILKCKVTIENNGEKEVSMAFIGVSSDRDDEAKNNPYRLSSDVVKCDNLLAIAEQDAIRLLNGIKDRFEKITRMKKLKKVWRAIGELKNVK